jgi:hypothetical protein
MEIAIVFSIFASWSSFSSLMFSQYDFALTVHKTPLENVHLNIAAIFRLLLL